ncbi:MAG TPA: ABC transporter, partial [Gammaproteobacteria bacterium]|nr:ABC transporter [Gammaproteobacteria bacterium]
LDGQTGGQVIDLMFGLARDRGTTLVLITHDPALAARCDRQVQLIDGRIVDDGRAAVGPEAAARPGVARVAG